MISLFQYVCCCCCCCCCCRRSVYDDDTLLLRSRFLPLEHSQFRAPPRRFQLVEQLVVQIDDLLIQRRNIHRRIVLHKFLIIWCGHVFGNQLFMLLLNIRQHRTFVLHGSRCRSRSCWHGYGRGERCGGGGGRLRGGNGR